MGRREQNKREKREKLDAEGLRMFLDQGYDRASIEQIAQAAGVARGTFYLYYPDKLALFEHLIDQWFTPALGLLRGVHDALGEATQRAESLAIYDGMAGDLALLGLQHAEVVLLAFRESRHAGEAGERIRAKMQQIEDEVVGLTTLAADRGLITAEDPRLTALVILGAVESLYYAFLTGKDLGDPAALALNVVRLFGKVLDLPSTARDG